MEDLEDIHTVMARSQQERAKDGIPAASIRTIDSDGHQVKLVLKSSRGDVELKLSRNDLTRLLSEIS